MSQQILYILFYYEQGVIFISRNKKTPKVKDIVQFQFTFALTACHAQTILLVVLFAYHFTFGIIFITASLYTYRKRSHWNGTHVKKNEKNPIFIVFLRLKID
jgi:hypothetical protein